MDDLLIIGAGGTSREIAAAVEDVNQVCKRWRLVGFLDDDPAKQKAIIDGLPVLGPIDAVHDYPSAKLIVGFANHRDPWARKRVVERIGLGLDRYASVVHPSACIAKSATIGLGTAVLQNVVITCDTVVGNHAVISQGVCMAHDQVIEDYVLIAPGAVLSGAVRLQQNAYIGAGSIILQRVTIGEASVVGIGSVVIRNVEPRTTVMGNPARPLPNFLKKTSSESEVR